MARLTPVLGDEIRKTAAGYAWKTGLGLDQMHPKHFVLLSDAALFTLSFFLYSAELAGQWADPMAFFAFFYLQSLRPASA